MANLPTNEEVRSFWDANPVAAEGLAASPGSEAFYREFDATREADVLAAVDAAAEALGNTRAVARAHYVHPHVVETYLDGTFAKRLAARPRNRVPGMSSDERRLLGYLDGLLRDYASGLD